MTRFASWGIIIDDIVFPDGRSVMGMPGGAGLYAAAGMRLWSPDVLLLAAVGDDFDAGTLVSYGLDPGGLQASSLPTPRAWQLFEENGRRTQIFRVAKEVWYEQLVKAPLVGRIPESVEAAHYVLRGDTREEEMVLTLVDKQIRLSAEPIVDGATTPEECRVILRCLAHFELFSPDERSAAVLAGLRPAADQLRMLAGLGPRVVSLRQGADGSLVYERERDCFWRVPAAPARVVDVTGAGNAYCGGLLVGWHESGDVRRAAAYAAASAAIAIEQVGPPRIDGAASLTEAASLTGAASLTEAAPLTQAVMIDARRRADRALEGIYAVNTAAL